MKRRFTILTAAFALLVSFAIPMGMWGQTTVEVTLSSGSFNNNVITWTCADGNITIQQLKGSGSSNPNSSYISAPRVYKQNILSFVGNNGYTITNIDIKCDGSYYGTTKYAGTEITDNNVDNNSTALTPTWSTTNGGTHSIATVSSDGLSEIYIQNGHSSDNNSQLRITKLTITYKVTGSVTATTVTINTTGLTNTDIYTSTTAGTLTASVTETGSGNAISGATVTWSSSDTDVATIDNSGTVTLVAVGTTTITASYAGESGVYGSSTATYELTVTSSEPYVQPTTIEIVPNYTFWGKTGQFSGGTYSELNGSQDNVSLHWTRGEGSTYANTQAMRFYKDNDLTFTAPEGYEITSIVLTVSDTYSDLTFSPSGYNNETTTWTGAAETVTMSRPSNASSYATISKFTITLAPIGSAVTTTTTINVPANFNKDVYESTTAGTLTATVMAGETQIEGATVTWSSSNTDVATITDAGVVTLVAVGTTIITANYAGVEDEYRPSFATYELTVTSSAPASTYTLANTIISGKTYIIVGFDGDDAYAMGEQNSNNRAGVTISVDGNTATGNAYVHEVVITALEGDDEGKYTIVDGGYLYAASSSSNHLKTKSELDNNGKWTIVIENGEATITAQGIYTRNLMRFNPNNGTPIFACYATNSTVGSLPKLYVKDETPVTETKTKTIIGYDTDAANGTLCWYLIASPVGDVAPANVTYMLSNSYDLFYFDHAMENEWVNYKDNTSGEGNASSHPGFGLEKGKGYLYANSKTVELEFPGSAYTTTDGRETVRLAYTNTGDGYVVDLPGWNLVGNPFAVKAYLEGNRGFYTMDMDGNFAPVTNASIESMEGIFVVANPEVEEDAVTFTTTEPAPSGKLSLNLSNGRKAVDRAIVRFDGGNQLPKLQLFGERTKLYIPVEGQDYAIVSGEEMGEMPVSFKAENNGNYTLSVNAEEVSFAYLHLIDNMTGNDVDLLQTPSYSFEAKTTDYESRFKLVFATGDNSNDDNFAFYSNGSFVINNEGNAELQVIDIMGRIVKSESINGCANVSVNGAAGVYMLRLVNGDNVKVQKVVVK